MLQVPSAAENWLDIGNAREVEVLRPNSGVLTVASRDLELEHGIIHYICLYMVDAKGNAKTWLSYPLMVDLTPPPIESLMFPRIYPGEPPTPRLTLCLKEYCNPDQRVQGQE